MQDNNKKTTINNKAGVTTFDDVLADSFCQGECETLGCLIYASDKYKMRVTDDGELVEYGGGDDGRVVIPEGIKKIWPCAFSNNTRIEEVVIPDSVTEIDDYAFFSCYGLRDIKFGSNVKRIGKRAFALCNENLLIDLPDSVEFIDEEAFLGCCGKF